MSRRDSYARALDSLVAEARHDARPARRASRREPDGVLNRAVKVLEAANEDPGAFRITSRYVIASARRER